MGMVWTGGERTGKAWQERHGLVRQGVERKG